MRWRALCVLAVLSCGGQTTPESGGHDAGRGTDTGSGGDTGSDSGTHTDASGACPTDTEPARCVCVCSASSSDSGCKNPECSFDHADCIGAAAGCPAGQICRAYGDLCTPLCSDDGGCPAGMGALHLLP
jgi:hypothetical protein